MGAIPRAADMDSDGDLDLYIGDRAGKIHYFENIGTKTEAVLTSRGTVQAGSDDLDVGSNACPDLVDWNGDGLLDLVVGSEAYTIWLYLNTGSSTNPLFGEREKIVGGETYLWRCHPRVVDVNGDGSLDLLVGNENGNVFVIPNTGEDPAVPSFSSEIIYLPVSGGGNVSVSSRAHIDYADWNGDGNPDIIVGQHSGVTHVFYAAMTGVDDDSGTPPREMALQPNYPNPFNSSTVIPYTLNRSAGVRLRIITPHGRTVRTLVDGHQAPGAYEIRWQGLDDTGIPAASGIYLVSLRAGHRHEVRKIALVR